MKIGAFEELVLLSVSGLGTSAYAVNVQQRIETVGRREASLGAVYAALDRLERKGLLRSKLGPVTHEQGGKKKRFYQITAGGETALDESASARLRLASLLEGPTRIEPGGLR